jgi:hypothetical protein
VRCPRCGNENPGTNRFCGMCGATLLPAPQAGTASTEAAATAVVPARPASAISPPAPPPPASPPSAPQNTTAPRAAAPVTEEHPIISGPSFLGFNEPAPRKRTSLSINPDAAPSSSNLDYLLEDDEEPRRGGAGKFILIMVALALAAGLGYLRWKNQNFGWLSSGSSKPAAATQPSDAADSTAATPSAGSASNSSPAVVPSPSQPATDSASTPPSPENPAPGTTAPTTTPPAGDPSGSTPAANPAPTTEPPASKDSSAGGSDNPPATTTKPIKPKAPAPDPNLNSTRVIRPAKAADPVSEAQKYIYGKGVRQDCDQGLRILKPAADRANPKAMIEMGALYSAGLCTPRDLPTAYRWFAMALRKEPDNQSVQTDLQKLWSEMTQPERQLAIKLSQ